MSNLSLGLGLSQQLILKCPICQQSYDSHRSDCLQGRLEKLQGMDRHIKCPKCHARAIGVNKEDFFECRSCHAQYTTGSAFVVTEERFLLDDPQATDLIVVATLSQSGQGHFPLDDVIAKVRKQIDNLTKRKRRKK